MQHNMTLNNVKQMKPDEKLLNIQIMRKQIKPKLTYNTTQNNAEDDFHIF
jgi:hypothetical protein